MRKRVLALLLIIILCGSLAVALFLWFRKSKPSPTALGWRARVSTLAGDGSPAFRDNAQSSQAAFADPFGIAVSADGTIFVSDAGDSNRIRKLTLDGAVTTLAGTVEGFADGPGAQAAFNTPSGIALDKAGNLLVADTGNNRVRKITPDGQVSTIAGDGVAGYIDGPSSQARFDAPVGVAVDANGNIYVADTYNDRIRLIAPNGQVSTVAGGSGPGHVDGEASVSRFDTPCAIVVAGDGSLIVADTGNHRLRKIASDRQVTTLPVSFPGDTNPADLRRPLGLARTHDGFLYVTEPDRARVVQVAMDGSARVIAGGGAGYADGVEAARFSQPAGVAIDSFGDLYLADSANYLIRKLGRAEEIVGASLRGRPSFSHKPVALMGPAPVLNPETLGHQSLLWPLDPQDRPHEVVATIGEARGSFDPPESRHHLHSGLDVFSAYGDLVRAIRSEKITSPLSNWGFGNLNEGMRVGLVSYIHIHVGRDKDGKVFEDPRFVQVFGDDGKLGRIRLRRGTRFRPGDAVGTVNRMYHVHLNVGAAGAEINPLSLSPIGFSDKIAPVIEQDGIQLFTEAGARLNEKQDGRVIVSGRVRIVVDAFDRADMNAERRRLGLYRVGFQLLNADGSPAAGFEQPRISIEFNRLPADRAATKIVYANESGITVYGNARTRFLYEVTNTVRDGVASTGTWDTSAVPKGDYILRIIAADYSGNAAIEGRDLRIRL